MLVIQLKKTDYDTKITETEKKLTDHDHDKYIKNLIIQQKRFSLQDWHKQI